MITNFKFKNKIQRKFLDKIQIIKLVVKYLLRENNKLSNINT
jgi:hypothetical protein